jgi:amino acid adenylation domain-containing protein
VNGFLLQHYLEETVARCPEKTAIVSGRDRISYRELWEKSSRLANQLVSMGLRPRNPVGILLHKSIEAIIALFAVLKAGGMYIPLDPRYSPLSRIKQILASSETRHMISDCGQWNDLVSSLAENETSLIKGMKVILADRLLDDTRALLPEPYGNPSDVRAYDRALPRTLLKDQAQTDDDTAYILYTSGSTGVPKGVMLSHRNARTFIDWALSLFGPGETDVFSSMAPLHFDLSVFDIHVSLACGACVHLVPHNVLLNPRALLAWIRENGITYFYSVPSIWASLLNYAGLKQGDLPALSHILFAGEIFPPAQLAALMRMVPHAEYYNLYGPTETNVCTWHRVKDPEEIGDTPVPIGRACAHSEIIVIKDNDEPASIDEEGELLVKGPIVTPGYYKNPQCTGSAFRKSPLPHHHGALFYKTGDIVLVMAPGMYRFVGRRDLMVKCSGFRVELQEVELALLKHGAVREAVAVPMYSNDRASPSSIAAFITAKDALHVRAIELKEFLARIVPRYMIPDAIEQIEEIPRNANGKADRRQLTERAKKMGADRIEAEE